MDENIKKHNIVERKIKRDIIKKNTIRKQLTRDIRNVARWAGLLKTTVNRRKKKKYVKNIERYVPQIVKNKKIVIDLIDDLEKRINDELSYSKNEISELKQTYKKEYEEMITMRKILLKAQKGSLSEKEIEEIAGISIADIITKQDKQEKNKEPGEKEIMIPKEVLLAKAQKKLNKEAKDVKKVNKELESEEKDKILFQNEIKRMVLEREILL